MRILHVSLRVLDLQRSVDFYTQLLGMHVLRQKDYPAYRFTLAFLGFQSEQEGAVLELQYKWDNKDDYTIGNGFAHLAIAVQDTIQACAELRKHGVKIIREVEDVKGGTSIIAFIADPDGYPIELVQRK
jgi:lactoylglutathione lyase